MTLTAPKDLHQTNMGGKCCFCVMSFNPYTFHDVYIAISPFHKGCDWPNTHIQCIEDKALRCASVSQPMNLQSMAYMGEKLTDAPEHLLTPHKMVMIKVIKQYSLPSSMFLNNSLLLQHKMESFQMKSNLVAC